MADPNRRENDARQSSEVDEARAQDERDFGAGKQKLDEDLERNPGIGQSKGSFATGIDPEELEGENTVEGDNENNAGRYGQVKTGRERTNA